MEEPQPRPDAAADPLLRPVRRLFGGLAGLLVFAMMWVTVVDVIGRYCFDHPLPGASEITEVMLGAMIFAALPLVVLENRNISMTLLTDRLSARGRRAQGMLVSIACALLLALIAWVLWRQGLRLASYGEVSLFLHLPRGPLAWLFSGLTGVGAVAALLLARWFFIGAGAAGAAGQTDDRL